jgi:Tol biopolymer transport system component
LFAWPPDGKWVVTDGLALLSTESSEMRGLTSQPMKSFRDRSPSVSPDGRTVAFSRLTGYGASEMYLLDLTEDLKPKTEPRRLASLKGFRFGSAWTPNGQEMIFTSGVFAGTMLTSLWKAPVSGAEEPEQLPFNPGEADSPAISRSGNRLAYRRNLIDANIWRLSLSGPGVASGPAAQLIASTRIDSTAQYSPNGKRIAFESTRGGVKGIWVSDADGSNVEVLFSKAGTTSGTPRWSPDGQRISFDFGAEGNIDIYVIRATGGKPILLTTDPAYDAAPSWSKDGKWSTLHRNAPAKTRCGRYPLEVGRLFR